MTAIEVLVIAKICEKSQAIRRLLMSTTGLLEKIQDGEVQATEPDSPMHGLIVNLALFCQIL